MAFDLVDTAVPAAADKAHRGFGIDRQTSVLVDAIKASGKFPGYEITVHEPMSAEDADRHGDTLSKSLGEGPRDTASTAACYAEFRVTYLTVFRTTLTKMLMTGFVVRYFPADPKSDAIRIVHSRPQRGEERIGLTDFSFSAPALAPGEREALAGAFKFMADRFMRKKLAS